jgi:hypothetical protein
MYASGQYTVSAIAKTMGVSRASIYRHLDVSAVLGARAGRGWFDRSELSSLDWDFGA